MKKCLLGIAMLLTASLSFAQNNFTIVDDEEQGVSFDISKAESSVVELSVVLNVSEEYVNKGRSFCIWIQLPEGMEPVLYEDEDVEPEEWVYFNFVSGCSLSKRKNATLNETYNAEYNTLTLIAKHEAASSGFPKTTSEALATFQVRMTDKAQTGIQYIKVVDKPYIEGYTGEDTRMMITTIDSPSQEIFPEKTENPIELAAKLTVSEIGYATLCWPVALNFEGTGLTAMVATQTVNGMVSRETVVSIPAATPVTIQAAAGSYKLKTTTTSPTAPSVNILKGTAAAAYTATKNTFALASKNEGVGFYRCKEGVEIPKYKAYIEDDSSADESFLFEETTGISSVEAEAGNTDAYTISGVKVKNPTQKGIYIINGKKVVK